MRNIYMSKREPQLNLKTVNKSKVLTLGTLWGTSTVFFYQFEELGKCDIQLASMPCGLLPSITLSFVIFLQFKASGSFKFCYYDACSCIWFRIGLICIVNIEQCIVYTHCKFLFVLNSSPAQSLGKLGSPLNGKRELLVPASIHNAPLPSLLSSFLHSLCLETNQTNFGLGLLTEPWKWRWHWKAARLFSMWHPK